MQIAWIVLLVLAVNISLMVAQGQLNSTEPLWKFKADDNVRRVAVSSDGQYVAAASGDRVYLLRRDSGNRVCSYSASAEVSDIAISSDGQYVAAGSGGWASGDYRVHLFNRDNCTSIWSYSARDWVSSVAISPDGRYIASGGADHKVYVFRRDSGIPVWTHSTYGDAMSVAISSDGQYIAVGSEGRVESVGRLYLLSPDRGELWTHLVKGQSVRVAVSSDGEYIAAASDYDGVYLFNRDSRTPLWRYEIDELAESIAVSTDGRYIAAGIGYRVYLFGRYGSTPLWRYETSSYVSSVAISYDGGYTAAGSDDNYVYLFRRDNGTPVWAYSTKGRVWDVAISSNGEYIAAGSEDGSVYVFRREITIAHTISTLRSTGTHEVTSHNAATTEEITDYALKYSFAALPWILPIATAIMIGLLIVKWRMNTGRVTPVDLFEVSVSVPSVGKTVTLEAASDHTVGSLVETVALTLKLSKGRAYAIEYAGRLISQPEFGKSLSASDIKEGSKLVLRVVE